MYGGILLLNCGIRMHGTSRLYSAFGDNRWQATDKRYALEAEAEARAVALAQSLPNATYIGRKGRG